MAFKLFKKYEDCEKAIGLTPGTLPDVSKLPKEFQKSQIADFQLTVIVKAHNKISKDKYWEPNFNDSNQWKYNMRPWIDADKEHPTGFGFSRSYCVSWRASAGCGSRHLLHSGEVCIHILNTFPEICKAHFLLK